MNLKKCFIFVSVVHPANLELPCAVPSPITPGNITMMLECQTTVLRACTVDEERNQRAIPLLRNKDTTIRSSIDTMQSQSSVRLPMVSSSNCRTTRHPRHGRHVILAILILCSTTTAFRTATTSIHRTVIGSSLTLRSAVPIASLKAQRAIQQRTMQLKMVKNRGGLEQRREGATPTGAIQPGWFDISFDLSITRHA
jgi:hypothetical protein